MGTKLHRAVLKLAKENPQFRQALVGAIRKEASPKTAPQKTAATEVHLSEIPEHLVNFVSKFGFPRKAWDGIHGVILEVKAPETRPRLHRDQLQALAKAPFVRWVSVGSSSISFGLEV
jgi:hypothetical protein